MTNSVIIKGNKYGIVVVLDDTLDFEELKKDIATKFSESSKFFGDAKMAITFEGRVLSTSEQREVLDIIAEYSSLHIVCVMDNDKEQEEKCKTTLEDRLMDLSNRTGQFYKGTLRSGTVVEFETSVIVMGDVNNGAKVVSKGNIIILGALKGTACAGATGNTNAFVVALDMSPLQIRIADVIARSPDKPQKEEVKEAKIAFLEEGNIYIEPLNRTIIRDIHI